MLFFIFHMGCGTDDTEETQKEPVFGESLEEGWNKIEPGGDTICSRGDDFAFAVRKGTSKNIVIDFVGGGGCWDEFTCGFADATFTDNVDWIDDIVGVPVAGEGIYDINNEQNPFKDDHHVMIPYCTGDVHWGNSTMVYGEGTDNEVTINHKGGVNAKAVLEWVFENYDNPERIFITGCSAGAYGSIMWSPKVLENYPNVNLIQFGDSGAGIVTDTWFQDTFPSWNPEYSFPAHIPSLDPATNNLADQSPEYVYTEIANFYSNHRFSQFNAYADEVQVFYYQMIGGGESPQEWTDKMLDSTNYIYGNTDNFSHYVAGGDRHCIIGSNDFYTLQSSGTLLFDWFENFRVGDLPAEVICTDCETE